MNNAIEINIINFVCIYLLLIFIGLIMKFSNISKIKLLVVASTRMTIQLILAGYILVYLLDNPSPILVILYVGIMIVFSIYRVLNINKGLNKSFRVAIALGITTSSLLTIIFVVVFVINESIFNPQYTIPLSGMLLGNTMTGVTLGVRTFIEKINDSKLQIEVLLNQGATPKKILSPFVNSSFETAILPTINTMVGMGIVTLPGMMTGQIISGESPITAIMYQISITIAISAVVCLAVFLSLNLGYKTLYNKENQFNL